MSEKAVLRAVPSRRLENIPGDAGWAPSSAAIVLGKDILELLSSSMYVDPMTIYREYAQNSADAIDDARELGLLTPRARGKLQINIDAVARSVRIRDNGTGVAWPQFAERLSNLGASAKRGTTARGFRGVGRLAGLGYCQELIFRSRAQGEDLVSELRWDCRSLKSALRTSRPGQHLIGLIQEVVSVRRVPAEGQPPRFFEVELNGVIRHRNDRLLNPVAVSDYLSQVAPVPFSPEFTFGEEITAALKPHVNLGELEIYIDGAELPVYRPHRNEFTTGEQVDKVTALEMKEILGINGELAAIVWILHHGYLGAIPSNVLAKGIRLRTGNVQVGDHALLEELFPESRFNGWAIGEVHIVDKKVVPNGRRDHFEQSAHFDNLLNQLTPIAREIAKRCRDSSISRNWVQKFELHKRAALEKAKAIARGGLSRAVKQAHADSVATSLKALRVVIVTRHISDEVRAQLSAQTTSIEARIAKLVGTDASGSDPLLRFKPQVRSAYQRMIELVYECTASSAAANALVEKILERLRADSNQKIKRTRTPKKAKKRC
jgi:hypothetical protein